MRVCYFGAYDPAYPRSLILLRGLRQAGAEVVECRAARSLSTRGRARELIARFAPTACDVILLAAFNQALAPAAARLARRHDKHLVVDAFTPLFDSAVNDRGTGPPLSLKAWRYRQIDRRALRLPDRVLVDTAQHRDYFVRTFGADAARITVIPVGASQEWFAQPDCSQGELVLFYGTYIPLHGIETILRAAALLPDVRFELIGRGQTYTAMQSLAAGLNLRSVTFREPVPAADLPAVASRAAVALGIFGTTDKAVRVVPNKVYQCLALGKAVITADTPALRAAFTPGELLLAVPPGDPGALAAAVRALLADPDRRAELGRAAQQRMREAFTQEVLGQRLLAALQEVQAV
ncbi:MAG: glycosyltransferase [Anaerolineae bacterium]